MIVYDAEIVKCIPDQGKPRDPALEYCAGWNDHANMGISVLCAMDVREGMPRIFCQDNLQEFATFITGRAVGGFNNHGFDDRLLLANGIDVSALAAANYDLCGDVREAAGEPRTYTPGKTRGGRRLDDLARVNLGTQKSMSGALAPVAWQQGRRGEVIDYCMRDVVLTAFLFMQAPRIHDPATGQDLTIPVRV